MSCLYFIYWPHYGLTILYTTLIQLKSDWNKIENILKNSATMQGDAKVDLQFQYLPLKIATAGNSAALTI
jgi:hypothetical protein